MPDRSMTVGGLVLRSNQTFTRPADTNQYALGDLVANSTTAASVTPLVFAISKSQGYGGMIRRVRLAKSGTSTTSANFRVHFYATVPTPANGDNGAWSTDQSAHYAGSFDVTCDKAFTDGAVGIGVPNAGSELSFTSDTYYVLLEARNTYTPASAETFTVELEVLPN